VPEEDTEIGLSMNGSTLTAEVLMATFSFALPPPPLGKN